MDKIEIDAILSSLRAGTITPVGMNEVEATLKSGHSEVITSENTSEMDEIAKQFRPRSPMDF